VIRECWSRDPDSRPTFFELLRWLRALDYRLTAAVDSVRVRRYVDAVLEREEDG
jgi:hypothetical protein